VLVGAAGGNIRPGVGVGLIVVVGKGEAEGVRVG